MSGNFLWYIANQVTQMVLPAKSHYHKKLLKLPMTSEELPSLAFISGKLEGQSG